MTPLLNRSFVFRPLPELSWDPDRQRESLEALAGYVAAEAEVAIRFYSAKNHSMSKGARIFQISAIVLVAAAATLPILAEVAWLQVDGSPLIEPIWSSFFLLVAGASVGLDRFLGLSSAWMRYRLTEMKVRRSLHDFLLDWEARRAAWPEGPLAGEVEAGISACKAFLAQVNGILADELDTWLLEFADALKTIEKSTEVKTT